MIRPKRSSGVLVLERGWKQSQASRRTRHRRRNALLGRQIEKSRRFHPDEVNPARCVALKSARAMHRAHESLAHARHIRSCRFDAYSKTKFAQADVISPPSWFAGLIKASVIIALLGMLYQPPPYPSFESQKLEQKGRTSPTPAGQFCVGRI